MVRKKIKYLCLKGALEVWITNAVGAMLFKVSASYHILKKGHRLNKGLAVGVRKAKKNTT